MQAWLYVLEINCGARIKAGRSNSLGGRLAQHASSIGMSGGEITRMFAVAVADATVGEAELLAALKHQPGADLAWGRETFQGVSFERAVAIAQRIALVKPAVVAVVQGSSGIVDDCVDAIGDAPRLHLRELLEALREVRPGAYDDLDTQVLGSLLRRAGALTVQMRIGGANRRGIHATTLRSAATMLDAEALAVDEPDRADSAV